MKTVDYRDHALKMFPWICARCGREFTYSNLRELTVHHKNHDHDCNPPDGSNWELLCLYCHDNEHRRQLDHAGSGGMPSKVPAVGTGKPLADLKTLWKIGKP